MLCYYTDLSVNYVISIWGEIEIWKIHKISDNNEYC